MNGRGDGRRGLETATSAIRGRRVFHRCLPLLLILHLPFSILRPSLAPADPVLRYDFAGDAPFIVDLSGRMNHGLALGARRVKDDGRPCLQLTEGAAVRLPEGCVILGERPARGAIELSVKPDFDPLALPEGVWEGWVVLIYFQKTSGNGLPDGYNEIGLSLHGKKLLAKVAGGAEAGPFAVVDTPLRKGQWTRLRLQWEPGHRALYVDGELSAESNAAFEPPLLDGFAAFIGRHPSSGKWGFSGLLGEVVVER